MAPAGSLLHERLAALIAACSAEHGVPGFPPHVTVLGAFGGSEDDVRASSQRLCQSLKPFTLRAEDVAAGELYFQCVYVRMIKSDEVLAANWQARLAFGVSSADGPSGPSEGDYMPHLSLIYGNLTGGQRAALRDKMQRKNSAFIGALEFPVTSLALWRTDPDDLSMATWEPLDEYVLGG
eukprot:SM000002S05562  [mRNA]  locus=s2:845846:846983:- [translate_table: standard]